MCKGWDLCEKNNFNVIRVGVGRNKEVNAIILKNNLTLVIKVSSYKDYKSVKVNAYQWYF